MTLVKAIKGKVRSGGKIAIWQKTQRSLEMLLWETAAACGLTQLFVGTYTMLKLVMKSMCKMVL